MRLLAFEIVGLFDRFSYHVELHQEERITILHGPNGFGKTTALQILGHALGARFRSLTRMPFRELRIHLENGTSLKFALEEPTEDDYGLAMGRRSPPRRKLSISSANQKTTIKPFSPRTRMRLAELVGHFAPGFERIAEDKWVDPRTGRMASLDTLISLFGNEIPSPMRETLEGEENEFLRQVRTRLSGMRVFVIDTQRLLANRDLEMMEEGPRSVSMRRPVVSRGDVDTTPAVIAYAEKLREEIRDHLRSYGVKASELDRSLPRRIMDSAPPAIDTDVLRNRYNAVVDRRQSLAEAGLLEEQMGGDILVPEDLDDLRKQVFRIYLDDMEKKLEVFTGFADRVQLFTKMINDLFKYKRIIVGTKRGFHFVTDEGKELSAADLSSGEQHQLVLLFDLLFRVDESALILVDEPEISLHVEWQQQVLKNFHAVSQLRDLDFLIATHSPDIIHDRWDLAVALGEQASA